MMSIEQGADIQANHDMVKRLEAAADEAYETSLIHLLYEIEEGPVERFFIDEEQGNSSATDNQTQAAHRIDMLCEALEINPHNYADVFIRGMLKNDFGEREISPRQLRSYQREGISIGEFVTRRTFDALPIERDEDGSGSIDIAVKALGRFSLELQSDGSFYTEYPPEDSDDDSVLYWSTKFSASVHPLNQTDV